MEMEVISAVSEGCGRNKFVTFSINKAMIVEGEYERVV